MACTSLLPFLASCALLLLGSLGSRVASQARGNKKLSSKVGAAACLDDIIIHDVPTGSVARIAGFEYRAGWVLVGKKKFRDIRRSKSPPDCQCCDTEDVYWVHCKNGYAAKTKISKGKACRPGAVQGCNPFGGRAHTDEQCGGTTEEITYLTRPNAEFAFGRAKTTVKFERGEVRFEYDEMMRMPADGTGVVEFQMADRSCSNVFPRDCPTVRGCGMLAGSCVQIQWSEERNCKRREEGWPPYNLECTTFLYRMRQSLTQWLLIITTQGGGGHIAAARNLAERHGFEWQNAVMAVSDALVRRETSELFTDDGYTWLTNRVRLANEGDDDGAELLDLMKSPCFSLFGEIGGMNIGARSASNWNDAQRRGNLTTLRRLISWQPSTDTFLGAQCKQFMTNVLRGTRLARAGAPSKIISTQPLLLRPIAQVVSQAYTPDQMSIDLYMTDLPTEQSFHFFHPVQAIVTGYHAVAGYIRLHTVAPAEVDMDAAKGWIRERTGLLEEQIVIERFLPVATAFIDGGLPRPGDPCEIYVKAQLEAEEAFLGGKEKRFTIAAEDKVTLVMLGSQPTEDAMKLYLEQASMFREPTDDSTHWVFLACGDPKKGFAGLYEEMASRAAALNVDRKVRAIPFTGQLAQDMEGRADITVTRTGGMTAGELLALAARGDQRAVFLHVESNATELTVDQAKAQLDNGMVAWEAGNARYLMQKLEAVVVAPRMLAAHVNQHHFADDHDQLQRRPRVPTFQ